MQSHFFWKKYCILSLAKCLSLLQPSYYLPYKFISFNQFASNLQYYGRQLFSNVELHCMVGKSHLVPIKITCMMYLPISAMHGSVDLPIPTLPMSRQFLSHWRNYTVLQPCVYGSLGGCLNGLLQQGLHSSAAIRSAYGPISRSLHRSSQLVRGNTLMNLSFT